MNLNFNYPWTGLYPHSFGLFTVMQSGVSSFLFICGFSCNHFPSIISYFYSIPSGWRNIGWTTLIWPSPRPTNYLQLHSSTCALPLICCCIPI